MKYSNFIFFNLKKIIKENLIKKIKYNKKIIEYINFTIKKLKKIIFKYIQKNNNNNIKK